MTTQEQIELIRQACIKANESILDLKFGCEVKGLDGFKNEFQGIYLATINQNGTVAIRVSIKREGHVNRLHRISSFSVGTNELEIIGRKIGLADILLTIEKGDEDSIVGKYRQITKDWDAPFESLLLDVIEKWDKFNDDIDRQSEKTIDFLWSLLCE